MMIHELTSKVGRKKARRRIGRGNASGVGGTSGRGHKGAKSRSGYSRSASFEGGQMPFIRRIPKRGFTNAKFRLEYHLINLKDLDRAFDAGESVDLHSLAERGLVRDTSLPLKVLGEGVLSKALTVTASKFSMSASNKIEAAGGSVQFVEMSKWTRAHQ